jgi:hypothetical protein
MRAAIAGNEIGASPLIVRSPFGWGFIRGPLCQAASRFHMTPQALRTPSARCWIEPDTLACEPPAPGVPSTLENAGAAGPPGSAGRGQAKRAPRRTIRPEGVDTSAWSSYMCRAALRLASQPTLTAGATGRAHPALSPAVFRHERLGFVHLATGIFLPTLRHGQRARRKVWNRPKPAIGVQQDIVVNAAETGHSECSVPSGTQGRGTGQTRRCHRAPGRGRRNYWTRRGL